jgi:hypothetical protein
MVVWKPIPGYEGIYEASNAGQIRSLTRLINVRGGWSQTAKGTVLTPEVDDRGYGRVGLWRNGQKKMMLVHRLVCMAFHGLPIDPSLDACHDDGRPSNCRPDNLRWDTRSGNFADQERHGTRRIGAAHWRARLTRDQVIEIRRLLAGGKFQRDIAAEFGVAQTTIHRIATGESYKDAVA